MVREGEQVFAGKLIEANPRPRAVSAPLRASLARSARRQGANGLALCRSGRFRCLCLRCHECGSLRQTHAGNILPPTTLSGMPPGPEAGIYGTTKAVPWLVRLMGFARDHGLPPRALQ